MKLKNKYLVYLMLLAPIALLSLNINSNQVHAQNIHNRFQTQRINFIKVNANSTNNRRIYHPRKRINNKTYNHPRVYRQTRTNRYNSREQQIKNQVTNFSKYRRQYHYSRINWNARDLGGYQTYHGYYVAPNRIIRGGNLHYISNKGIRQLHQHHINKIIDLRSITWNSGMRHLPDPGEYYNRNRGIRATYYVYPTNTDAQKIQNKKNIKRYGEIYNYGNPFVTYWTARKSYNNVFKVLLNNKHGATYIHCLEGHDRTGTTSALILAALGVRQKTIYDDFLLTNVYQKKYPYVGQLQEFNKFYNTIHYHYGNIMNYLRSRKGVGLTNYQIKKLRKMYLVKRLPKGFMAYR